jgi:spore maturation protein CgeB
MNVVLFYHSFTSCWNHGNVHFLRGLARVLVERGHRVTVYEPRDGWSRSNALREHDGAAILAECSRLVPGVTLRGYDLPMPDLDEALQGADLVIAHEWSDPALIAQLGQYRARGGRFLLFFHDTHHRAVTAPAELALFDLESYDAVLVFGEVLREVYAARGWGRRVVTWHEAADVALFAPRPQAIADTDLIWIGNFGDGERDRELQEFLVEPAVKTRLRTRLHGVRYPDAVREALRAHGFSCRGWLPNHRVPDAFGAARLTMHVPRRPYVAALPGIPTIRVFEALACGIPLVSAPWHDAEGLFPAGSYLRVANGMQAAQGLRRVIEDRALAAELSRNGRCAVAARHTCAHRVDELLALVAALAPASASPAHAVGGNSELMVAS